jgi:LuxR family maltose regulon positive regulatory protein
VVRERLLRDLTANPDAPVLLIVAGAGYGKTTLLDQWSERESRPVARLRLRPRHDDGHALLNALVDALHEVEPVPAATRRRILTGELDWSSVVLPAFARLLARRTTPCAVVLDDVHELRSEGAIAVLDVLVHGLPAGWQLVLSSRTEPPVGVERLQAEGVLWCLDAQRLLLTPAESLAVLRAMGVDGGAADLAQAAARAEGWPIAVYLSGVAMVAAAETGALEVGFAGDDSALARYLRDEVLRALDDERRAFLLRTSILDELEPMLCDAVLARDDSAAVLRELADEHLFVRTSDGRGGQYKVHHLLREMLRDELMREEPVLTPQLHRRASEWYARNGDPAASVEHALATDDDVYVDSMVWAAFIPFLGGGLSDTVRSWLDAFSYEAKCRRPALVAVAAWLALTVGDMATVRVWVSVVATFDEHVSLPDGTPAIAVASLLRSLVAADGVAPMGADARASRQGIPPTSAMWSMVLLLEGHADRLVGDTDRAVRTLEEGAALGLLVNPAANSHCASGLAHVAAARGDWAAAEALVDGFVDVIDRFGLDARPAQAGPLAFAAFVRARAGRLDEARRLAKQAAFLAGMMVGLGPWLAVESRVDLAHTALVLGDPAQARSLADEARALSPQVADSPVLLGQLEELDQVLDAQTMPLGLHASAMTPAELRVLRYLPTHLTFGAIADELYVSRNTVKTQAIAIYRKLGVSSRDAAVAEARRLQLLE